MRGEEERGREVGGRKESGEEREGRREGRKGEGGERGRERVLECQLPDKNAIAEVLDH